MEDNLQPYVDAVRSRIESAPLPAFGIAELNKVLDWSGYPTAIVQARILLGMIAADQSDKTTAACADAIADLPNWEALLVDLFSSSVMTAAIARIASRVLQRKFPGHPLASVGPYNAMRIVDGIDDGHEIKSIELQGCPFAGHVLLLSSTDPIRHYCWANSDPAQGVISVAADNTSWLERGRLATPAFILVIGDSSLPEGL